jgi:hypothetical protein
MYRDDSRPRIVTTPHSNPAAGSRGMDGGFRQGSIPSAEQPTDSAGRQSCLFASPPRGGFALSRMKVGNNGDLPEDTRISRVMAFHRLRVLHLLIRFFLG